MIEGNFGILHPGEMGVTVALAAQNRGLQVYWVSEGRSTGTCSRAEKIVLNDASSLSNMCGICSTIICVCPPSAALDIAEQVALSGYRGMYIDANAISPQHSQKIGQFHMKQVFAMWMAASSVLQPGKKIPPACISPGNRQGRLRPASQQAHWQYM